MQALQSVFGGLLTWAEGLVGKHPGIFILVLIGLVLISMLATALPKPEEIWPNKAGAGYFAYRTFWTCLHIIAGNFGRVFPWFRFQVNNSSGAAPPKS